MGERLLKIGQQEPMISQKGNFILSHPVALCITRVGLSKQLQQTRRRWKITKARLPAYVTAVFPTMMTQFDHFFDSHCPSCISIWLLCHGIFASAILRAVCVCVCDSDSDGASEWVNGWRRNLRRVAQCCPLPHHLHHSQPADRRDGKCKTENDRRNSRAGKMTGPDEKSSANDGRSVL